MPKCPNPDCGHEYISGELHCPECFEPLPMVAAVPVGTGSGPAQPPTREAAPDSGSQADPFAGLFNDTQTPKMAPTDDIRKLFNPVSPLPSKPEPAPMPLKPEPVPETAPLRPAPVPGTQAPPRVAFLKVTHGQGAGTRFALTAETNIIGRWDPAVKAFVEVDLTGVDGDAKVSRKHARITFTGGSYFIEDLESANGTYINRSDRLIPGDKVPLSDGDEIIMGKTFLKFILG